MLMYRLADKMTSKNFILILDLLCIYCQCKKIIHKHLIIYCNIIKVFDLIIYYLNGHADKMF